MESITRPRIAHACISLSRFSSYLNSWPLPGIELSQKEATDDLYARLVILDDLRKKGILTDEQFQAEKKKILSRFN